jgi:hypothetical protein
MSRATVGRGGPAHTTHRQLALPGLSDHLFLSSSASKETTLSFIDVFRREGMSEECGVKRKVLRAAKGVLDSDAQLMYVLLVYDVTVVIPQHNQTSHDPFPQTSSEVEISSCAIPCPGAQQGAKANSQATYPVS